MKIDLHVDLQGDSEAHAAIKRSVGLSLNIVVPFQEGFGRPRAPKQTLKIDPSGFVVTPRRV